MTTRPIARWRAAVRVPVLLLTVSLVSLLLGALSFPVAAQQTTPNATPVNPNANVSFPPSVYVLRGNVEIHGSANLPNMNSFFLEFRPLAPDLSIPNPNAPWFPATLPSTQPVQDGVLGVWNTATAPDGLYEMRLTINVTGQQPTYVLVSPLRIENTPPPFVATNTPIAPAQPTLTIAPPVQPTLIPTPTQVDTTPRVTALIDANVRKGDDVRYDKVGFLLKGQSAVILGISSFGSGWYYIQLDNGGRGFISPTTVQVTGDTSNLPAINPPPLPTPAATATPVATPVPPTAANLQITAIHLEPAQPVCGQTYTVFVTVTNVGSQVTASSGIIAVQDVHVASGTIATKSTGGFPVLNPGQGFQVFIPLTANIYYNEQHRIDLTIDPGNQIPETNKSDNYTPFNYVLAKGSCP